MIRSVRCLLIPAAAMLAGLAAHAGEPAKDRAAATAAEFENRVRPLLVEHCFKCHGPKKQESNLRLDSRAAIMQGGDSGPAVVPGKPGESLIVQAVRRQGDLQMPPNSKLNADQVATLAHWVADGALWPAEAAVVGATIRRGAITAQDRAFWSLQPVRDLPPPEIQDRSWIQTSVDPRILARLEARGLHPAPPADRRTLIRRATFDLTGLPPTPGEVDAFVADRSPDAFERLVDRLLASPAYGERWGRHWLDVVRYADTAGETADYPVREAYRYRDYVIDAFNRDLPYDRFVREQIAGDILASGKKGAEYARMVTATGFIAVSRRFGFDSENYHYLTLQDTIDTTGQAFLGLTLGCARCHDHKYDPVSARDYYALYGIFDSTLYPFAGAEQKPATRSFASRLPRREAEALRAEIARNGGAPGPTIATLDGMDGDFEIQKPAAGGSKGSLVSPWLAEEGPNVIGEAQSPFTNLTGRKGGSGVRFPADAGSHRAWQHLWPARRAVDGGVIHVNLDFRMVGKATGAGAYRFALAHGDGGPAAVNVFFGSSGVVASDGDKPRPIRTVRPGNWYNLRLAIDLKRRTYSGAIGTPGDMVNFDGRRLAAGWDGTLDTILIDGRSPIAGARPALDVDNIAVRETAIAAPGSASPAPAPADRARRLAELIARRNDSLAYAVAEGTPQDARLQRRGEPAKPGEVVPRRFLEILGGDPVPRDGEGSGRRELAEWLVRPSNPLTARVMVNRIWSGHFGSGLVSTENDFGRRGSRPSHPELLDHLAARFVASGWSVKAMHRLILLSATYQQSSEPAVASAAVGTDPDPTNALLGHFPRRRLDAESIRDAILMLGGGLDRSPGGPHPFPPVGTTFTQHSPFSAVYPSRRRSVYLMTQRIRRHPYLALFDGPDPNASTAHRTDTTVPTQALFFLNDPFVHEQADGLARRLTAARSDETGRIRLAFAMTLAREPTAEELASTSRFLARYRHQLAADGSPADQRERRAWSALARTLFARNEFVFVD